ncbi:MAG: hypothetical protein II820_00760 [Ruminiclostridium sp.]|nr:hypothetical protein [Ruminiclostridium sp.]
MAEITAVCVIAVIMAVLYGRTAHPKLYAFFNAASGVLSLAASQIYSGGGPGTLTPYNTALSVVLGVPGTVLHMVIETALSGGAM